MHYEAPGSTIRPKCLEHHTQKENEPWQSRHFDWSLLISRHWEEWTCWWTSYRCLSTTRSVPTANACSTTLDSISMHWASKQADTQRVGAHALFFVVSQVALRRPLQVVSRAAQVLQMIADSSNQGCLRIAKLKGVPALLRQLRQTRNRCLHVACESMHNVLWL